MPSNIPTPTTTSVSKTGNWWDSLGTPQYGGTITFRMNRDYGSFDPYFSGGLTTMESAWLERLHTDDWRLDPTIFPYKINFRPSEYVKGLLAESWEFPNTNTYVVHLRQGIHWQDIPPVNGREFTSDDVVYDYDREYGLGDGFTKPSPFQSVVAAFNYLKSVTATDRYTVVFNWTLPNPEVIMESLQAALPTTVDIVAREAIQQWGDVGDWHHGIGTGPFILQDYVTASSVTLVKNTNYWGHDERYPQNQLPYIDTLKILIITDDATALAGIRTGKIDIMDGVSLQNAQLMQKTNPKILQITTPNQGALSIDPRNDVKPFNDIRVREAMQMAIDLPTIANAYYGGTVEPYPSTLTSNHMTGWGFPYMQWPQNLKDEYAYNPTAAKQLLAAAGYPNGFNTDVVAQNSSDLGLVQVVKSYFAAVGINMSIQTMDDTSWTTFVQNGHKQDAMAQKASGTLGNTYEPVRQLTKFQSTYAANYMMVRDPVFDAFYDKAMAGTSVDDIKKIMSDANEYVARQHLVVSLLQPNLYSVCQPWLKGFSGQDQSIGGSNGGPHLLGFYMSRFWIDQTLK